MALLTQAPKGTQDLLPRESAKWRTAEEVMRSEAARARLWRSTYPGV